MGMGMTGVIQHRADPSKGWRAVLSNCFVEFMSSECAAFNSIVDEHFTRGIKNRPKCLRHHYNLGYIDVKKFLAIDFADYDMILDRIQVPSNSLKSAEVERLPYDEDLYGDEYKVSLVLQMEEYDPDEQMIATMRNLQDSLKALLYYDYQGSDEYRIVVGFN